VPDANTQLAIVADPLWRPVQEQVLGALMAVVTDAEWVLSQLKSLSASKTSSGGGGGGDNDDDDADDDGGDSDADHNRAAHLLKLRSIYQDAVFDHVRSLTDCFRELSLTAFPLAEAKNLLLLVKQLFHMLTFACGQVRAGARAFFLLCLVDPVFADAVSACAVCAVQYLSRKQAPSTPFRHLVRDVGRRVLESFLHFLGHLQSVPFVNEEGTEISVARIRAEMKLVPNVIYQIDLFEARLIRLDARYSKRDRDPPAMSNDFKRNASRDFKVDMQIVNETLEAREREDFDDDDSDDGTAGAFRHTSL
jgi:hypothetical protein